MRILLQILGLLIIIWMGWHEPYRDVMATVCPWMEIAPSHLARLKAISAAEAAAAAATPAVVARPRRRTPGPLDSPQRP